MYMGTTTSRRCSNADLMHVHQINGAIKIFLKPSTTTILQTYSHWFAPALRTAFSFLMIYVESKHLHLTFTIHHIISYNGL